MGAGKVGKGLKVLRSKKNAVKKNRGRVLNPNVSRKNMLKVKSQRFARLHKKKDAVYKKVDDKTAAPKSAKQKIKGKKGEEEEDEIDPTFGSKEVFVAPDQNMYQITEEDNLILKQFQLGDSKKKRKSSTDFGALIVDQIDHREEEIKQIEYEEDILKDPTVLRVYSELGQQMKDYRHGKLLKALSSIPYMKQWEKVLELTDPMKWSPQGLRAATRLFASNMDSYRAEIFFEKYLVETIRADIKKHHKLNVHYYWAVKEAVYKPQAFFKGIVFPFCRFNDCTIKEAVIIASALTKVSIPTLHASIAVMKIADMEYSGPNIIFLKTLIEKRYALPSKALQYLLEYFLRFESDSRKFPVIWHQTLLSFAQIYSKNLDEMQKEALKSLAKKKRHHLITPEILNSIDDKAKQAVAKKNLTKSYGVEGSMEEEGGKSNRKNDKMVLE